MPDTFTHSTIGDPMAYADTYTPDGFIRVDRVGARGTPVVGHDNLVPPACRRRARPRRYARTTSYQNSRALTMVARTNAMRRAEWAVVTSATVASLAG